MLCEVAVYGMALICLGALVVASGAVMVSRYRAKAVRALSVSRLRPTLVVDVQSDDRVRIDGIVMSGEDGTIVAPCSGQAVVWFRVRLRTYTSWTAGEGAAGVLRTIIDQEDGRSFQVEDSSGRRALLVATRMHGIARADVYSSLSAEAHGRMRTFLAAHGYEGATGDVYEEERLRPGESVSVLGVARLREGPSIPANYRDAPSTQLILQDAHDCELIVASHESARRSGRGYYLVGKMAVAAGAVSVIAGVALRLIGIE